VSRLSGHHREVTPEQATEKPQAPLELAAAEIEEFVATAGWDQRPALFALARSTDVARDDPDSAARLGLDAAVGSALVPIEQEALPDAPLDEALSRIAWPAEVAGCALSQEIIILPPDAAADIDSDTPTSADVTAAAAHPRRREARLVVAVLRDGTRATLLRLRPASSPDTADRGSAGSDPPEDELLVGPDLAPNLAEALLATLRD
jgi:hypothetical protein